MKNLTRNSNKFFNNWPFAAALTIVLSAVHYLVSLSIIEGLTMLIFGLFVSVVVKMCDDLRDNFRDNFRKRSR